MEFGQTTKSVNKPVQNAPERVSKHILSLYLEPPSEEITLLECKDLVVERLKILQVFENLKEKYGDSTSFKEEFERQIAKVQPLFTSVMCSTSEIAKYRRRDEISHFMLRMACSMTVDLTQRFIARELELFKFRFSLETESSIIGLLEENKVKLEVVSADEVKKFEWELWNANRIPKESVKSTNFYKLRFTDCRVLVRMRKVFLHNGYCYVTIKDLIVFLTQKFRLILSSSMHKQRARLEELDEDDRLLPLLRRLVHEAMQSNESTTSSGSSLKLEEIDQLSGISFPLCMRSIHSHLRTNHHLKYFARQQYGLFLKGAGLSYEGSVAFFRQEFTKKITLEKFEKNYLYNIGHMYGKEGNRVDHKPMTCASIILNNAPGQSDCHGCPFKHSDPSVLQQRLESLQISKERAERIVEMASKNHRYDMACTRVFELTHNMNEGDLGEIITTPNQYFDLSRKKREVNPS